MPDRFWNTCTAALQAVRQNNLADATKLVELAEVQLTQGEQSSDFLQKRKSYLAQLKPYLSRKAESIDSTALIDGEAPDEHLFYPRPIRSEQRAKLCVSNNAFTIVATSNGIPVIDNAFKVLSETARSLNKEGVAVNIILVIDSDVSQADQRKVALGKQVGVLTNISRAELPDILSAADALLFIGQAVPIPASRAAARRLELFAMGRPVILVRDQYLPAGEHRKDSYQLSMLDVASLTEAIKTIQRENELRELLGRSAVNYYLRTLSRKSSNSAVIVTLPETSALSSRPTSNSIATATVVSTAPTRPQNAEVLDKLRKRITQLESDKAELSERLLSMPSIDPLCISDPGYMWPDRDLEDFGIIVFAHTRLDALGAVLESLKRQNALQYTEVWLDGYQGNHQLKLKIQKTIDLVKTYQVKHLHTQAGNYGFRKMLILGLTKMCQKYRDILILEDDCFPTREAVAEFRKELELIRGNKNIFSVYGHHFKVEAEKEFCARFQGWGWATTSQKLMPMLRQLIDCYSMPEETYLKFIRRTFTAKVKERIDITPPRQPSYTLENFFAWDETLCLLTALNHQVHKPTKKQTIYNCGMGKGSTHFDDIEQFRKPPFNLITPEEVWQFY